MGSKRCKLIFFVLALMMSLAVVFTTTYNIANAQPGDGYTGADKDKSEEQKKAEEDNAKKEEEKDKERAEGLNPGRNSPDGNAREEGERKENNPTEDEKEAKEKVEEESEKKQEEEKDKEKEREENKGTDADPRASSPDKDKQDEAEEDKKENEKEGKKKEIKGVDSKWTLYAQIIMGQAIKTKEKEESKGPLKKAFKGVVSGIIGDGGTTLDIPYTKFSALNKELTGKDVDVYEGGEEGQALASTLATFNQYGYIKSLSGNKLATGLIEGIGDIGRFVGGGIAYIGLIFYGLLSIMLEALLKGLVALNPYSLLGLDKGHTALPDNPVSKLVRKFFDAIGLNGDFFTTLAELGLIIIVIIFVIKLMIDISTANFKKTGKDTSGFLVRLFVVTVGLPLLFVLSASVAKTANNFIEATHVTDSPAMSHLVDSRAMASGLNMSPSALQSSKTPHVSAKENYIDTDYLPAKKASRNLIHDINAESYKKLYNNDDDMDISYKLVSKWLTGSNFDVNTYMADLRSDSNLPGSKNFIDVYSKGKNLSASDTKKLSRRDLESAIWSSTQNTDGDLRKPDHENYDPTLEIGVENDSSFSTQSVALMLQSSFDSSSAKFYSYNIAPKGEQANAKNNSTIKTEWREITMPGDGMFGVFGSWLSLISKSISYILIASAVIMALLSTTFVQAIYAFIKQVFQSLVFGSLHSLLATFLIYLGTIGSLLMAVGLPGAFIKFIEGIQSVVFELSGDRVPASFVETIGAIISMVLAYWIAWGGRVSTTGETPARLIVTFFVHMALEFESRVSEMNRAGGTSFRVAGEGLRQSGRKQMSETSERIKAGAIEGRNAMKYGTKGSVKGATRGAIKGAVIGGATGGLGGAVAGGAKEGLKGGLKGGNAGRKNRTGSEEAFNKSLDDSGLGSSTVEQLKSNFKEKGSRRFASKMGVANEKGQMTNELREQSMSRYQSLKANEIEQGIDENATGSEKYKNVVDNTSVPFSDNLTVDKNGLDEISGDHHLYDGASKSDLQQFSQQAGDEAKNHITTIDKKPAFSQSEIESLSSSKDENDFVDRLHNTKHGMDYAMQTENAQNMLQGSQFVDDNGNVSMNKIDKFQKSTNRSVATGETLSKNDLKDKALLDSAFVMGAKEKYRKPSQKFKDNIGSTKSNNYYSELSKKQNANKSKPTQRNKNYNRSANAPSKKHQMTNVSQRKQAFGKQAQQRRKNAKNDNAYSRQTNANKTSRTNNMFAPKNTPTQPRKTQSVSQPQRTQSKPTQPRKTQSVSQPQRTQSRPTQPRKTQSVSQPQRTQSKPTQPRKTQSVSQPQKTQSRPTQPRKTQNTVPRQQSKTSRPPVNRVDNNMNNRRK
ncbi:hypothetical protein [Staphylococcus aureus]|uniref:hypothetical protein n=1 Tax=Staphylococcus aureus TaxID=1280 RepID=UPI0038B28BB4